MVYAFVSCTDAPSSGLPGNQTSNDPSPGMSNLSDVNSTTVLTPLVPEHAPNVTVAYPLSFSFQNTGDGNVCAFMNTTVHLLYQVPILSPFSLWIIFPCCHYPGKFILKCFSSFPLCYQLLTTCFSCKELGSSNRRIDTRYCMEQSSRLCSHWCRYYK
jgi:hypothetical protein